MKEAFQDLQDAGGDAADLVLLSEIKDLSEHIDESLTEVGMEMEKRVAEIKADNPDLEKILATIKGNDGHTPTPEEVKAIIEPLLPALIPEAVPGNDYVLTEEDKAEIAQKVHVGEKVIERIEVIKEQPIVTEVIKEVAVAETAEKIRDKLELLEADERLDVKAVRGITVSNITPVNPKIGDLWIATS